MRDLVSRETVLRCIKKSREDIDWGQSDDGDAFLHYSAALYRTIASPECLPSAEPETGRWIPVKDMIPNNDQTEFLITVLDKEDGASEVYKGFYQDGEWWTQWCHGCKKISEEACGDNVVTAWMELPKAYDPKWIDVVNEHCICPICGSEWSYFENETERFKCCPNCGARMNDE